ncbi:DUF2155 domain-containing protein [Siculibacillus lacustris]|uniref:DUF2155 domain-containing protein n=1 Tax=Siculibacillus lacustris TaxID=1549641 RepID=A0A4V6MYZ1_9HYPH|nr:DUF2155 domain-containing protein [Siculibacillus lacustris]TBW33652.1 DUF2155 domain-containing protein [Siculibacillus lacustris]
MTKSPSAASFVLAPRRTPSLVAAALGAALAAASIGVAVAAPAAKPATPTLPVAADDGNKIADPFATFSGLDKITGRIISFDVAINETVQFGALQVTPRVCYSRPPTVAPLTTSFVEVDEITLDNKIRRIFSGWMFADSPGLHAVEHAVYDVWLTDCKAATTDAATPAKSPTPNAPATPAPPAPPAAAPAAPTGQGGRSVMPVPAR